MNIYEDGLGPREGKKSRIKTDPSQKLLTSHGFKAFKTTKKETESAKPTTHQRLSFANTIAGDYPTIITRCSGAYSPKEGAVHGPRLMILHRYCNLKSTQYCFWEGNYSSSYPVIGWVVCTGIMKYVFNNIPMCQSCANIQRNKGRGGEILPRVEGRINIFEAMEDYTKNATASGEQRINLKSLTWHG